MEDLGEATMTNDILVSLTCCSFCISVIKLTNNLIIEAECGNTKPTISLISDCALCIHIFMKIMCRILEGEAEQKIFLHEFIEYCISFVNQAMMCAPIHQNYVWDTWWCSWKKKLSSIFIEWKTVLDNHFQIQLHGLDPATYWTKLTSCKILGPKLWKSIRWVLKQRKQRWYGDMVNGQNFQSMWIDILCIPKMNQSWLRKLNRLCVHCLWWISPSLDKHRWHKIQAEQYSLGLYLVLLHLITFSLFEPCTQHISAESGVWSGLRPDSTIVAGAFIWNSMYCWQSTVSLHPFPSLG